MKIISVALTNVKSYDKEAPVISFQQGVNAIIGENGSGKSTLCEAIGFALFDYLHPYSQADFVREGEKSGKVMVTFESDIDGKRYRVERGVNQSRYEVIALETGSKVELNGKEEVISWLKEQLGVPEMMNIQTLWKSSLGVPQGKFTNDFAETPSIRAELFNPLLEVDVYRNLWRDMKGVIDVLYQQHTYFNEQITRLETSVEGLPDLKKQSTTLKKQIKQTEQQVSKLSKKITENQKKKQQYDHLKESIQTLSQSLELHQEKQKDLKTQLKQANEQLKEITKAETLINKHKTGYQQYQKYSTQLDELYQKNKQKKKLESKAVDLEKTEASLIQRHSQYEKDVTVAKESKKRLEQLKPQVEKQKQLENKLDEIKQHEKILKEINQQQEQINQKISSLRKKYQKIKKQIDSIQQLKPVAENLPTLQKQKENLLQKQSILSHQQDEQQKAISLLSQYEQPKCPTCTRPLKEEQKKKIIQEKNNEITKCKQTQEEINKKLDDISKKLKKATEAQQQLKRLTDLKQMSSSLQEEATEQKEKKKTMDEQTKNLSKKIRKKKQIKDELSQLHNPESAYQQATVRYEDHQGKEVKLKSVKQQLQEIKEKQNDLLKKLKKYHDLQQNIDTLQTKQKQVKASYETVLRYKDTAQKKTQQEKQVNTLTSKLTTVSKTIEQKQDQLKKKQKQFDTQAYQHLEKTLEQQKQQQIQQQTQITEWDKQKNNLDTQLKEKNKQKDQLNQTKKEQQNLKKDIEFAQFLRETYKQTRPLITEILVEAISREADRMYRQLRGAPSEELSWTKDYEIIITEHENKRSFHKLSGGEQMCAALSVRLAILKLLSNMDIVFLDEPTMNLDEHKKDNLVGQLRELSGFSQIFVISHDETFESMTEHIITLEKRKGATRLMQHFQGGF
ncbi:MAG: SMC family ATPase [Thermoplasmatota archaeon]